jgi:hypothetical protein
VIFELECEKHDTKRMSFVPPGDTNYEAIYVSEDRKSVFAVIMAERGIEVVKIIQPHVEYLAMKLEHAALHEACRACG